MRACFKRSSFSQSVSIRDYYINKSSALPLCNRRSPYPRFERASVLFEEEGTSTFFFEEWAAGRDGLGLDCTAAALLQVGAGIVLVQDWAPRELQKTLS